MGTYKDYLNSEHWNSVKNEYFNKNPYRCYFCGSKYFLNLHHITYDRLGKEDLSDLVYLCKRCHKYTHFSKESEVVKKWLERIRLKRLKESRYPKKKKTLTSYLEGQKTARRNYWRNRMKKVQNSNGLRKTKNYAGLFTWKAEEVRKQNDN